MNDINRWLRSKTGIAAIVVGVILILIVAIIGQNSGWWGGTGTAGLATVPQATYPAPKGGYSCLPSSNCDGNDFKFFVIGGTNMASLVDMPIILWIGVPGDTPNFKVGLFDGDSGMDNSGAINHSAGNWDDKYVETTYTLFADPMKDGKGQIQLGTWNSMQGTFANNTWTDLSFDNVAAAKAPSGHYFYRLEVRYVSGSGVNRFKVRTTGYLSTGRTEIFQTAIGLSGGVGNIPDRAYTHPQLVSGNPGPTEYNGDFQVYFFVRNGQQTLEIWNGDFDRGTSATVAQDTDDPNTEGKPQWSPNANIEGAQGRGAPPDNSPWPLFRVGDPVYYELIDPNGQPVYTDTEPSGTEEWERFVISTDPAANPDLLASAIPPGLWNIHIIGLDSFNAVWLRLDKFEVCDIEDGCGPCVWPGCDNTACPRTIGYWKNNVKKVLIDKRTQGVQESPETLDWALKNVALGSKVFRTGINVQSPAAIANPVRLTDQEAHMILQRDQKTYPGGKEQANSMLARALQQNLAAWLNLASGKISDNTYVTLNVAGGPFQGTVWEALQEAENIILNGGNLERAKDIGDQINNGLLGEDAAVSSCDAGTGDAKDYQQTMPKDKQPPEHSKMPKAPKPTPLPPGPTPEPACMVPDATYGGGYAIIALNPEPCLGEQNGLLFHGTSLTQIDGTAFSNGCVRAVGTTNVEVTAPVEYVADQFGDMTLINMGVQQVAQPLAESVWRIAPPDCSDPAAIQMNGKDFKGEMLLQPGLYCISGDVTINNNDVLIGTGVTLVFLDGKVTINGGATVQLTAPGQNSSPALPGVLFYVPDTNNNPVLINGNSNSFFSGVIYAPASEIEVLGTGYVFGYQAQFIGWDVRVGGTADVIIDYLSNGAGVCK